MGAVRKCGKSGPTRVNATAPDPIDSLACRQRHDQAPESLSALSPFQQIRGAGASDNGGRHSVETVRLPWEACQPQRERTSERAGSVGNAGGQSEDAGRCVYVGSVLGSGLIRSAMEHRGRR